MNHFSIDRKPRQTIEYRKLIIENWSPYYRSENQRTYELEYYWEDGLHFTWKQHAYNPKYFKKIHIKSNTITSLELEERMKITHKDAYWLVRKINQILYNKEK